MEAKIVSVGNSKGIRIPAGILKQWQGVKWVKLEVEGENIIMKPKRSARAGWEEAFSKVDSSEGLVWGDAEGVLMEVIECDH